MTDDDIQQLLDETRLVAVQEMFEAELFAFAKAIAAKEREACAKVVDAEMDDWDNLTVDIALNSVAAQIRARGE